MIDKFDSNWLSLVTITVLTQAPSPTVLTTLWWILRSWLLLLSYDRNTSQICSFRTASEVVCFVFRHPQHYCHRSKLVSIHNVHQSAILPHLDILRVATYGKATKVYQCYILRIVSIRNSTLFPNTVGLGICIRILKSILLSIWAMSVPNQLLASNGQIPSTAPVKYAQ